MKSGVQQNMATSDLTPPSVKGFVHFLDTHNFRFYFGVQVPFIFIFILYFFFFRDGKGPVYLYFSVNGSGHFCGMAEMVNLATAKLIEQFEMTSSFCFVS
jgi:hypothetical protein